jgi:hypothetical protein
MRYNEGRLNDSAACDQAFIERFAVSSILRGATSRGRWSHSDAAYNAPSGI